MLHFTDLPKHPLVFAIFDGRKNRIVHYFDQNAVLPEYLTFL